MAYQPKSYKKFVATAATATLVASAVVPAAFANEAETAAFTDVPKSYEAAIDFVVTNNISKGLTETKYGIDAQIKRGDVAIIIANAAGLNNKDAKASGFKDVPTRGTLAVNSLKEAGIVDGKSTTNFGFADPITRGEAAIMIQRAFKITGDVKDVKFTDVSDRYDDAVAALLAYKVTQGVSTTKFGTDNPIKRGDFAKFIYALKDKVVVGAPTVSTVKATNGTVTSTFNIAPETAPAAADFTVTRSINGGAAVTVTPTNFKYNEATKSVTFDVPEVAQTNAAQTVTYSVKYKDTAAQTGSFTVAATPASAVHSIAAEAVVGTGDAARSIVTVIFTAPVSKDVATNVTNYTYDQNANVAGALFNPTSVSLNTEAVGPFAAGQVATLTFPAGTVDATQVNASLRLSGFSSTGETFKQTTDAAPSVFAPISDTNDVVAPVISNIELSAGSSSSTSVSAGTGVTLTLDLNDTETSAAGAQYRLVRPDGTRTAFANLSVADGKVDENPETFTGTINTTGLTPGEYVIEVRSIDSTGNVTAADDLVNTSSLFITGQDLAAPAVTPGVATYNAPGTVGSPARSVTVTSSRALDEDANVASAEYRVESYNALSGTFTTVVGWTNAAANDGAFNERDELFTFNTGSLAPGNTYRIQVRSTDAKGNVSQPRSVATTNLPSGAANSELFTVAPADRVSPVLETPAFDAELSPAGSRDLPTSNRDVVINGSLTAGSGETVTSVEYSVLKDTDLDGAYETTVQAFTSTGVSSNDGAFNENAEDYTIETQLPTDGNYRILVRGTNSAGNTTTSTTVLNTVVDATAPTATITPNTATIAPNDFVVTFSESVKATEAARNGEISVSALDEDNYTLRVNGQILDVASTVVANGSVNNSFIVTFAGTPTPNVGTTVNVVGVQDVTAPGNTMAPASYTIR